MLAQMEQVAAYNSINWSLKYSDPGNTTIGYMTISSLLCPSDTNVPAGTQNGLQIGYTSYPNNIGTYYKNNNGVLDGPAYVLGSHALGPAITLALIVDGTSNTTIFSESLRCKNETISVGRYQVYQTSDTFSGPVPLPTLAANCQASTTVIYGSNGAFWLDNNCGKGGGYFHALTPNKKSCFFNISSNISKTNSLISATSNHAGGVSVAFLVGSVRFVKDSVNPNGW